VVHFRIKGKRDKICFVPVHVSAQRLIEEYLGLAGHGADAAGPLLINFCRGQLVNAAPLGAAPGFL
jgi:hypothetical protein